MPQAEPKVNETAKSSTGQNASSNVQTTVVSNETQLRDALSALTTMSNSETTKAMSDYKFWSTQPVPKFDDAGATDTQISTATPPKPAVKEGPIENKSADQISKTPAALPEGFEWSEMDLAQEATLEEVRDLLCNHYVEDNESQFRFDYGFSTLNWALKAPGWRSSWHVGVRASKSQKLVAFISAIPIKLRVRDKSLDASEVNFICVHKKLRSKRLAPVLITEITRRCNVEGVFQAIYTAGVLLPRPVSTCRYYHRSLDWEKLYAIDFAKMPAHSSKMRQIVKYKLPEKTSLPGLRLMRKDDVATVTKMLQAYLDRMSLAQVFDDTEVMHWLFDASEPTDPKRVVWTYVIETDGRVTDFFSFYRLNSTVIQKSGGEDTVRAAYMFYYGTESAHVEQKENEILKPRLNAMVKEALILAKQVCLLHETSDHDRALTRQSSNSTCSMQSRYSTTRCFSANRNSSPEMASCIIICTTIARRISRMDLMTTLKLMRAIWVEWALSCSSFCFPKHATRATIS